MNVGCCDLAGQVMGYEVRSRAISVALSAEVTSATNQQSRIQSQAGTALKIEGGKIAPAKKSCFCFPAYPRKVWIRDITKGRDCSFS